MLCLGLGGAGKSTILAALAGEDTNCIVPTMGFCIKTFYGETASFTVKELGGDEKIRPYWSKYFDEYEAIVRVTLTPPAFFIILIIVPRFLLWTAAPMINSYKK